MNKKEVKVYHSGEESCSIKIQLDNKDRRGFLAIRELVGYMDIVPLFYESLDDACVSEEDRIMMGRMERGEAFKSVDGPMVIRVL